ncbi:MAG: hypothetical protein WD770_09515 [Actinomycetota bacterium]
MNDDEVFEDGDDVVVLGPEPEPPAGGPRGPRRWRPVALVLAVGLVAAVAWINRPRPEPRTPIADSLDPGSRQQPLYTGAVGRLIFTVNEEIRAGELIGERLWIVSLENGAVVQGPLIPPVGTDLGLPAGPGVPPNRQFTLGPPDSPAGGHLAFLADGATGLGGRFAYVLDVGASVLAEAGPVAEAEAISWDPQGALLTARGTSIGEDLVIRRFELGQTGREMARLAQVGAPVALAVSGGRTFLILDHLAGEGFSSGRNSILTFGRSTSRTLLTRWHVLGHGLNAQFLVEDPRAESAGPVHLWAPGSHADPPVPLPGFEPERIVGWTSDRQHYAALGGWAGEYGLWFVSWPNTPVFLMTPLNRDQGESVDDVAFDREGRAAFFVFQTELWMVEIGSERVRRVPLPEEAARELPSGPLVWVP